MKGMKGRFLKKLKSIPTISTLKQGLIFQFTPTEKLSNQNFQNPPVYKQQEEQQEQKSNNLQEQVPGKIGISECVKDLKEEETELGIHVRDKENLTPSVNSNELVPTRDNSEAPTLSESGSNDFHDFETLLFSDVGVLTESRTCSFSSFQRQELNSGSLCNQDLLPAVEQTVKEHTSAHEVNEHKEEYPSLSDFEEKCPPAGGDSIILYTTSMRGIRKTYEDCKTIRFLLESLRVLFHERDVSMHVEFREELWKIMGSRVVPPRLFIKGRYIGGADEVVKLHEQGKLRKLLQGIPLVQGNHPCSGCAGVRFVLCLNCNGSRRVFTDEGNDESFIRCSQCNENGLVKCPICC
ncbi:hypothetical protein L1049_007725 [Liquidambar formosana]|uniref:Glutaredoxin domain-containing protein n=1 Tax=Liquidambar formosana TaxID=63359 RepID=A0AAP0X1T2_LIQFO